MSVYNFAPCPDLSTKEEVFATWENGFSDTQLQEIIRIGESLEKGKAIVGGRKQTDDFSEHGKICSCYCVYYSSITFDKWDGRFICAT